MSSTLIVRRPSQVHLAFQDSLAWTYFALVSYLHSVSNSCQQLGYQIRRRVLHCLLFLPLVQIYTNVSSEASRHETVLSTAFSFNLTLTFFLFVISFYFNKGGESFNALVDEGVCQAPINIVLHVVEPMDSVFKFWYIFFVCFLPDSYFLGIYFSKFVIVVDS